jgi:hypothetical protein
MDIKLFKNCTPERYCKLKCMWLNKFILFKFFKRISDSLAKENPLVSTQI